MTIVNIIDHRKRPYRFLKINAVMEAAWHDNKCKDADQITPATGGPDYDEREHVSVGDAFQWAEHRPELVTLYLYDEDSGIYAAPVPPQDSGNRT